MSFLHRLLHRLLGPAPVRAAGPRPRPAAFHDPLTGLANRALFADRLAHAIELHRRDQRPLAVVSCGLDDFADVNDGLGREAGDAFLRGVAARLASCARAGDTAARLGGDEFALVLEGGIEEPAAAARRILDALAVPVELGGRLYAVRASVGVATAVNGAADTTSGRPLTSAGLLGRAEAAMRAAKGAGKGRLFVLRAGEDLPPCNGGKPCAVRCRCRRSAGTQWCRRDS